MSITCQHYFVYVFVYVESPFFFMLDMFIFLSFSTSETFSLSDSVMCLGIENGLETGYFCGKVKGYLISSVI